ncbi:MAG TPA: hypothetical protein VF017_15360 [Thermoanaerobaculia bacterium]|nr:hypothetical protein [Thermoanaerobaculia bacterium]
MMQGLTDDRRARFAAHWVPFLEPVQRHEGEDAEALHGIQIDPDLKGTGVFLSVCSRLFLVRVWDAAGYASSPLMLPVGPRLLRACTPPEASIDENGFDLPVTGYLAPSIVNLIFASRWEQGQPVAAEAWKDLVLVQSASEYLDHEGKSHPAGRYAGFREGPLRTLYSFDVMAARYGGLSGQSGPAWASPLVHPAFGPTPAQVEQLVWSFELKAVAGGGCALVWRGAAADVELLVLVMGGRLSVAHQPQTGPNSHGTGEARP